MITNTNTYAVGYCRFSSDTQRDESIDAQKRAITEYATNENIIIVDWYLDYAQSGTTDNRKEFQRMIADSKNKKFSLVLVHKLDRFSRDKDDTVYYKVELKKHNVKVFSVTERFDDSPEGVLMESVVEGIAAYYSKNLSRETMKGMRENAYNAKSNGSKPPFGYKLQPRVDEFGQIVRNRHGIILSDIVLDEKDSVGAKLIFDRVLENKNYNEICDELTAKGFKTSYGNNFSPTTLLNILRNEKYTGTYVFGKYKKKITENRTKSRELNDEKNVIRIKGGLPQIITDEQFIAVQKLLDSRVKSSPGNKIEDYLLSGKMFCGECLSTFVGERQRKVYNGNVSYRTYYRCTRKKIVDGVVYKQDCHNTCIRRDEIENLVINEIAKVVFSEKNFEHIFELYNNYKDSLNGEHYETDELNKKLFKINKKIENLTNAIAELGFSSTIRDQLTAFEKEKQYTIDKINNYNKLKAPNLSKEKVYNAYIKVKELFKSNSLDNMQALIDIFVNKILVFEDRVEIYINSVPCFLHEDYVFEVDIDKLANKKEGFDKPSTIKNALNEELMCINNDGSPGRVRTYGLSINSRVLHHWATGEYLVLFFAEQWYYITLTKILQHFFEFFLIFLLNFDFNLTRPPLKLLPYLFILC